MPETGNDPRRLLGERVQGERRDGCALGGQVQAAYLVAGAGLYFWRRWAARLAAVIALATLGVLVAFGWHVITGGAYEMRTVGAMLLRSGVWIVIALMSCRALGCRA